MSVTISLYRVVPHVTYLGSIFDYHTRSDYDTKKGKIDWLKIPVWKKEEKFGAPPITEEIFNDQNAYDNWNTAYDNWSLEIEQKSWSNGKFYGKFEMFRYKEDMNYKEWLALKEKFKPSIIHGGMGYALMNLPIQEIYYIQGWFFKKRFFKRKNTCFCTTSKKKALDFLRKYLNLKYNKTNNSGRHYDDEVVKNIIPEIEERWNDEDTFIFECMF